MTNQQPSAESHRVVAIIQARMGSVRFPKKVLQEVNGVPLLKTMVERIRRAKAIDEIVLAVPESPGNDPLVDFGHAEGLMVVTGSETDVLSRYAVAAEKSKASIVIRLTGDCPLIDWAIIDECVKPIAAGTAEFACTSSEYPDGLDVEVFTRALLDEAASLATDLFDREHVTPYMRRKENGRLATISPQYEPIDVRITLDQREDFETIEAILRHFGHDAFTARDIDNLASTNPELFLANQHLQRNEGATMTSGQKMWKRAQKVIAGGNMLLSKRPDMHSPTKWPSYFSRAKGSSVWDLDGKEFIDFGFMGIGTNILGYGYEPVDEAVRKVISDGNLSTLNAPEEVLLAEKLCELHPWAEMVRFTRSGGEAGAVAARIARAATGKDKIVFCGYHGWHDWYLAANLADDQALDDHLLPGLSSAGVPRGLAGTAVPFEYNNLESLEKAVEGGGVAAIYMEVERSTSPAPGFLEGVREIATRIGAVLVFDECTSGFRRNLGGVHMFYGVEPDIAVFGKTLGNGYAINAVIGRQSVMEATRKTFISSTFWTERIGLAAALKTLEEMETTDAQNRLTRVGEDYRSLWSEIAEVNDIKVAFTGVPALTFVSIEGLTPLELKTIATEHFLTHGFLAGSSLYAAIPHESIIRNQFPEALASLLSKVSEAIRNDSVESTIPRGLANDTFTKIV